MSKLLINEEQFWNMLDEARAISEEDYDVVVYLTNKLSDASYEEIFAFGIIIDELMYKSYNDKLWCADYLVHGGASDDAFDYFRLWLISQGKKAFYDVIENPDNLINYIEISKNEEEMSGNYYENEDFLYIAIDAYATKKCIESFSDVYDMYLEAFEDYKDSIGYVDDEMPELKFTWNEENPKSMEKICPKLFSVFKAYVC